MRIGIVGAGMIGSTVAKLWADAGHDVRLASRHPDALKPLVDNIGKRASAGTPAQAAAFGDVVMITVPLRAMPDLEREAHREGDRVGIPLASDDREAMDVVAALVRDAGFDPVIVGPLARGKEFEPGTPPYNTGKSGRELRALSG